MMGSVVLLMFVICCLTNAAAVNVVPATVSDSYGNVADQNSKIQFASIPEGEAYVVDPESYSYGGLLPLFKGVQGFVNICFGKVVPFESFLGLLDGSTAIGMDFFLTLGKWGGGFAACVLIGLLFVFIFPIVGCCFCCCRVCCKKCGGKMVQKRTDKTSLWRACIIITLFVSCTFLGCGMICTYVVNERMSTMFSEVATTIDENVDDFSRFANNTVNQINYVAINGYNFTARVMLRDLDNIGPLVGGSVQDAFNDEANVDDAFDQLLAMDPLLKSLIDGLETVDTSKTNVISSITTMETAMTNVADDIDATFASCGAPCGAGPNTADLRGGSAFDPSTMPDFSTELGELQAVYNNNLTGLVLAGKKEFNNISGIVEEEAAVVVTTIRDMVNTFDDDISTALATINDMLSMFDTISNLTSVISNLEETVVAGDLTVGGLEKYRWMGGVGLTCFVLLILVLQLTGLILGCLSCCCGGNKDELPTERGGLGNCAGILLMASVGLVFIFGALIMLLVWLTFLVGAPLESLLCVNLRDTEYTLFKDWIDGGDPADGPYTTFLGDQTGYTLGEMVFQNDTIPLTISGLLTDCDANAPAWKALYISEFFDIDEVMDYKSAIDVDGEIDKISVDLSSLELLDANTKTQLTDMSDAITGLDFDGLVNALDGATVTADFSALTTSLQTAADSIAGTPALSVVHQDLLDQIDEINRIETTEFAAVKTSQDLMLDSVVSLNATASTVPNTVADLITTVENTQTELQTNGEDIVKNESKIFAQRVLGIADQFVNFVNSSIQEEVGRCKPVSNFYQSVLVNTFCGSVMDSWNGVWFTLGWCVAFMVLGIILSTKLAKHVRRMKELHPDDQAYKYDGGDDESGPNSTYGPGKGKVHPI